MKREELALLAHKKAMEALPQPGLRIVVIVTDVSGEFVGVGTNTDEKDTSAILRCALNGKDRIDHRCEIGTSKRRARGK